MLLEDYKSRKFLLDDVQFALGIVLSNLGEDRAAEQVIAFLGTNRVGSDKQRLAEVMERRQLIEDSLNSIEGVDIVSAFIQYLFNSKVLERQGISQLHATKESCTLEDLLQHADIRRLYEDTMNLLFSVSSNMLLYRYMFTPLFMKSFRLTIMQMVRKSKSAGRIFRRGGLSDSDYTAVLHDFSKFIRASSCNGSYNYCSGDPDAFLCSAPLRKWYPASSGNEYLRIIHGHGQDSVLSEDGDGTTALDLKGISDTNVHVNIDFRLVCAEISEASKLLFTHNGSRVAFYDIFSYHREQGIPLKKKELRDSKGLFEGIDFVIENDTLDDSRGDSESIRNKYCGRRQLCALMESAFSKGIMKEDLYPLYLSLLQATASLHTKNAQRLFKVNGQNTKQLYTNGQMFQVLVNGYNSLYSLLAFLKSSDNKTGITEDSFPTRIFRDGACLKRFKTLEDYVQTSDVIFELMDEVSTDPARSVASDDGFLSNDRVYDMLCQSGVSFDSMLGALSAKPLSYIAAVVEEVHLSGQDMNLMYELLDLQRNLGERGYSTAFLEGEYYKMSYAKALMRLNSLADTVIAVYNSNALNFYAYHYVTEFFELLKIVMQLENFPVVNENDMFILTGQNTAEIFGHVEASALEYKKAADAAESQDKRDRLLNVYKQLHSSYLKRILCCCYAYEFFTGVSHINDSFQITLAEFHDLLYVNDVICTYLKELGGMLRSMPTISDVNDMYLVLISFVSRYELLGVPDKIVGMESLDFLFDKGCSAYLYADKAEDLQMLRETSRESSRILFIAVNRFFDQIHSVKKVINTVREYIDIKIKVSSNDTVREDAKVHELLQKENIAIVGITHASDAAMLAKGRLGVLVNRFDKSNYACVGGRLLSIRVEGSTNSFIYVHKHGYASVVDKFSMSVHSRELTNEDLAIIRSITAFKD